MSMTPTAEVLGRRNGPPMHVLRRRRVSSFLDRTSPFSPGYTPKIMADGNSGQHAQDRAAGAPHYISSRKTPTSGWELYVVLARCSRSYLVPPRFPLPIPGSLRRSFVSIPSQCDMPTHHRAAIFAT
ncbi:hypothetical protein R3P38DRAFT_3179170 [Favolaschia claudopus]|uniref:Uncharacterized protein n=1 Tax=Favolaschia claudopus TaxID=2862362 RepID=A0AAW0CVQ2_9AGAR